MQKVWPVVVGVLVGITGAAVWALAAAIYQPFMQPHGFSTDSTTGQTFPELGGNNTYWPRDIRQLAILLAFAGMILICRARVRGVVAGAIATIGWLGADLWLDRVDVAGRSAATWLAVGGVAVFAVAAVVAARVSGGRAGSPPARHLAPRASNSCSTVQSGLRWKCWSGRPPRL